jgi:hypothetical protein
VRTFDDLYPYKHSIVDDLYIKTADDNYVAARWCFYAELDVDFFWLAVQCVEKYLKATLLLNEQPAKTYGHDIEKLYRAVLARFPELLPTLLTVPKGLPKRIFSLGDERTEEFIKRLHLYGQPDNRYLFVGYIRRGSDILKLDQLVFAVRRLCQPLESHFLGEEPSDSSKLPHETVRQLIAKGDASLRNLHSNLDKVLDGDRGELLRRVLLNWNFSFAPADYKHGRMSYGHRLVNPVLVRRFLDPLDAGTADGDQHADDLWLWAKENIYMPKEFVRLYEKARTDRKAAARAKQAAQR